MTDISDDLPDEIIRQMRDQSEQKKQRIESLGSAIGRMRDDAVLARSGGGIEQDWTEDEEGYQGIDEVNRATGATAAMVKATNPVGGVTNNQQASSTRATVFLNITRPYTDAASARVSDMLLPTDDRAWAIKPTPIPEMVEHKKDMRPAIGPDGQPIMRPQGPDEQPQAAQAPAAPPVAPPAAPEQPPASPIDPAAPAQPGMPPAAPQGPQAPAPAAPPPQVPVTLADLAKKLMDDATERADKAEKRIDDWLVESQFHAEVRKVIEDCARLGTGILKGPFPVKRKSKAVIEKNGGIELEIKIETKPASKRVDPWNFFPDPACGEDIHNGAYCFERDEITEKQLRELAGVDGYLADEIKVVIKEGPGKKYKDGGARKDADTIEKNRYEIWYFYGEVSKDDLAAVDVDMSDCGDKESLYAVVTLVNDRCIKAALNPLDSGSFPYDLMPWQRRCGMPWGMGVARQIRPAQGMINAANRNMLDNAGASGGPILAVRRDMLEPADGKWTLTPRKIFFVNDEGGSRPASDAIYAFNIPNMQEQMMGIINFALKMAEDTTGLPQLMQGSQGAAPDTVGGMQMLNNNASTVLRRIARTFDDCITEPHIRRYYEFLLMYGEDDSEKGDFTIDARGSSALVERDLQNQALMQMGQMITNPAFGIDPKKYFAEMCKAQHLDPKRLQYTDEEQEKMAAQPAPPPIPIAVAQINAQAAETVAKINHHEDTSAQPPQAQPGQPDGAERSAIIKSQTDMEKATLLYHTAQEERQFQAAEAEKVRAHELQMRQIDLQIKQMELQHAQGDTLDKSKVDLAKATMDQATKEKLAAQEIDLARELDEQGRHHDMMKTSLIRDDISTDMTP